MLGAARAEEGRGEGCVVGVVEEEEKIEEEEEAAQGFPPPALFLPALLAFGDLDIILFVPFVFVCLVPCLGVACGLRVAWSDSGSMYMSQFWRHPSLCVIAENWNDHTGVTSDTHPEELCFQAPRMLVDFVLASPAKQCDPRFPGVVKWRVSSRWSLPSSVRVSSDRAGRPLLLSAVDRSWWVDSAWISLLCRSWVLAVPWRVRFYGCDDGWTEEA